MIAYRRADVAELNAVARTLLDRDGRLGHDRLRLDNGIELAAGDRVLCTRNDRRLAVTNGSRGTVQRRRPRPATQSWSSSTTAAGSRSPPVTSRPDTSASPTRSPATRRRGSRSSARSCSPTTSEH